jgi:hypothetical protein
MVKMSSTKNNPHPGSDTPDDVVSEDSGALDNWTNEEFDPETWHRPVESWSHTDFSESGTKLSFATNGFKADESRLLIELENEGCMLLEATSTLGDSCYGKLSILLGGELAIFNFVLALERLTERLREVLKHL